VMTYKSFVWPSSQGRDTRLRAEYRSRVISPGAAKVQSGCPVQISGKQAAPSYFLKSSRCVKVWLFVWKSRDSLDCNQRIGRSVHTVLERFVPPAVRAKRSKWWVEGDTRVESYPGVAYARVAQVCCGINRLLPQTAVLACM
jgi:hypothetical protein